MHQLSALCDNIGEYCDDIGEYYVWIDGNQPDTYPLGIILFLEGRWLNQRNFEFNLK